MANCCVGELQQKALDNIFLIYFIWILVEKLEMGPKSFTMATIVLFSTFALSSRCDSTSMTIA